MTVYEFNKKMCRKKGNIVCHIELGERNLEKRKLVEGDYYCLKKRGVGPYGK